MTKSSKFLGAYELAAPAKGQLWAWLVYRLSHISVKIELRKRRKGKRPKVGHAIEMPIEEWNRHIRDIDKTVKEKLEAFWLANGGKP